MRVIYTTSMIDKILQAKASAERENKVVERVLLTQQEMDAFRDELNRYPANRACCVSTSGPLIVWGIPIKVEENEEEQ